MTTPITRETLRQVLTATGKGRELSLPGADAALDRWCDGLRAFADEYRRRFGELPDPLGLWEENPLKARAFFETDTLALSTEMKVAVWRILLGCEIRAVEAIFRPGHATSIYVELTAPAGGLTETYVSQAPADFRLIRHLGTIRVDGRLELQGYYAFAG